MKLDETEEMRDFRMTARTWLDTHVPEERPPAEGAASREFATAWLGALHEGGWAGLAWPEDYGGKGLSPETLLIWYEEYVRARAPSTLDCTFVALNHAGPTLIACGSDAQKAFHLPRILDGRAIWCQGFSEPGSGSDLASLKTTGRVEGDHLVVNGQKIWSSFADIAQYQELLIRTEPGSKRHKGLSWVICDMSLPGITVRPIKNMAGVSHFAEVFYDDVRIPLTEVVGGLHNGWATAMTTLGFERRTAAMALQLELSVKIEELIEMAGAAPRSAVSETLCDLRAEAAAIRAMTYRTVLREPETPFDGSLVRLAFAELAQRIHRAAADILGPEALTDGPWTHDYLESYSETIAGGTAEIQRNIIGERILGLPREARA
ncbi:acyl-CoA dehydrogenase family protein [Pseudooceanicola sp.]|uniref:acyl-CoA dehydrogenase family protein n=1 Tax=Pseudooceanicola sp. TaxID=1914328 RepID=UPI0035C6C0A6